MVRSVATILLALLLAGCAEVIASPSPGWRPLSRLTVHNQHEAATYLRANWTEGMEQTSIIPVGDPLYISGSIAGAFPERVEILDANCAILGQVIGRPGETQALVTITVNGVDLRPIAVSERPWQVAEVVDDCRTRPNLP